MGLGIAFLSLILVGSILLFVFAIKQAMLNRQQKQFLSSVTHELKSPLSSLQLCLETLQNRPLNAQQSGKLLHMMQKDSWRLIRLVDQILVSSRLERGIDPDEIWVLQPPQKFLENILSEMNQNLDDKSRFVLNCKVQEDIYLWERPLKMVIVNLLENALKYSPIHSPIELSLEQVGGFYLLQVKDQGFGVPKPEQKKIFRMFQRGMHSNENAIPGTGLGLFIAYNVVKSMKGRIWVESEGLNRGSTFLMKWKKRTLPQSHAKKS
jgi:signal transduction histidine kinase